MILINPRFNRSEKCTYFTKWVPLTLPISLAPLAMYLNDNGKNVKIFDGNIHETSKNCLDNFSKDISHPYIFGISSVTANITSAYNTAKILKTLYPESVVIMGGIHPTVLPEEPLSTGYVDIVVRGEGEETLNFLYDRVKNGMSYKDLNGMSYISENGEFVHNPPARLFPDLNLVAPFPYHLYGDDINKYNLSIILVTRGCPYECIFCSSRSISGKKYRYVNPEKVIQQLDLLVDKYKQKYIYFTDDNLVIKKSWTFELCELMYKKEYYKKVKFSCSLRGDVVTEEILGYLKKAGFVLLNFGIESVHNRLLEILKKGETIEQMTNAVQLTHNFGMRVGGTFILGLPTETKAERKATFKWARRNLDFARFNNPSPYPGTELYEIAKQEGRLNTGENWSNLNPVGALVEQKDLPYVSGTCTEKKLRKDILYFNYLFWVTPKALFLLLFEGSPLWFSLRPKWYLYPSEWLDILKLVIRLVNNLCRKIFA